MFRRQGSARSDAHNRIVASYLAVVGGFVNSAGFVLIGSFTSHVTGNVGRLADDLAAGDAHAAVGAASLVGAFFAGAFVASMTLESGVYRKTPHAYAAALAVEATALLAFTAVARPSSAPHLRIQDAQALLLCAAMGMQNSLVTRLSGAVIRTTHLTGVVTDLGIEAARWFRRWRSDASARAGVRLTLGPHPADRPLATKAALLGTILVSFVGGALIGTFMALRFRELAMLAPTAAITLCAIYAYFDADPKPAPANLR
jgi:uncharacterized membrane protein YoaK (UPF0700 family)